MKVRIKTDEGKKFVIPVPMWVLKIGLNSYVKKIAVKHIDEENRKYVENIDFDAIFKNFKDLKEYKGLKIIDIKSSDGTEVTITV